MADSFRFRTTSELVEEPYKSGNKVDRLAIPFQPDAVEIELRRLPFSARFALYTILFLLIAAVAWASWAKIDRTVTARGKLVSQSRTIVKQPYRSSVIRSLDVKAGDYVERGSLIASLDPTLTKADRGQLEVKNVALDTEMARLLAEQKKESFIPVERSEIAIMQLEVFKHRQLEKTATLDGFEARILSLNSQYEIAKAQTEQTDAQIKLAELKLEAASALLETNTTTKLTFHERRTELQRLQAAKAEKQYEQERYQRQIGIVEAERSLYLTSYSRQIEERVLAIAAEHKQLEFELQKADRIGEFDEFAAEADGIVLEVTKKSVGSVVEAAEVLFTFVPTDKGLDIGLELSPQDIGWVHVGQPVRIKLDPFPFQRHGTLEGVLSSISPDALQRQVGAQTQVYYKARVTIKENKLKNLPEGFKLLPGITSTAEIKIGKRTVLSYITDPFHKALDESLKEPN